MIKIFLVSIFCFLTASFAFADTAAKSCAPPTEVLDWYATQAKQMGSKIETLKKITLNLKTNAAYVDYLCVLPALNELDLRSVSDLKVVAELLATVPAVKSISLEAPELTSLCLENVCPLANLSQLEALDIFKSKVRSLPAGSLPTNLTKLDFSFNNRPEEGQSQVPFETTEGLLAIASTAVDLNLDGLYITDLSFLREFTKLKTLHLYNNQLTTAHLPDLVASPSSATLDNVYVDGNNIEDVTLLADFAPLAWEKGAFMMGENPFKICPVDTANAKFNAICTYVADNLNKNK